MAYLVEPEQIVDYVNVAKDVSRKVFYEYKDSSLTDFLISSINSSGELSFINTTDSESFKADINKYLSNDVMCIICSGYIYDDPEVEYTKNQKIVTYNKRLVTFIIGKTFIFAFKCIETSYGLEFVTIDPTESPVFQLYLK